MPANKETKRKKKEEENPPQVLDNKKLDIQANTSPLKTLTLTTYDEATEHATQNLSVLIQQQ